MLVATTNASNNHFSHQIIIMFVSRILRSFSPSLTIVILTLSVWFVAGTHVWASGTTVPAAVSELQIVTRTNEAREQFGLPPLTASPNMAMAANAKAALMSKRGEFEHTLSNGATAWDLLHQSNYCYQYAGENLAVHYTDAAEVVDAWMNSPSHRENLLNPEYEDIGIGFAPLHWNGYRGLLIVQLLGTQMSPQLASAVPVCRAYAQSAATESIT